MKTNIITIIIYEKSNKNIYNYTVWKQELREK